MKLQTKKRVWSAVLVAALAVANFQAVDASTMSKAKDAKKQAEQELNEANRQIEEIEQQKSQLQGEIDEKDAELVNLLVNIGILEDELKDKNVQLEQVKEDLAAAATPGTASWFWRRRNRPKKNSMPL